MNSPSQRGFPEPWAFTNSSPLWQWSPVNAWLRAHHHAHDDWDLPTVAEVTTINARLGQLAAMLR